MKKRLFGGLILAGALTVWSTAAVLADDGEALHGPGAAQATAAINTLQTDPGCNPDLSALAKLSTKDPAKAHELIAGLPERIAQVKADATEQIVEALSNYQDTLREPREGDDEDSGSNLVALTVPDFTSMATAACQQITALYNSTAAAITALPAPTVTNDRDRENDDEDSNDRESLSRSFSGERD